MLISPAVLSLTLIDEMSVGSAINSVYMYSCIMAVIVALLTVLLVGIVDYDLVDSRRRSQKDVLRRRVVFFVILVLLPIIWFLTTTNVIYDSLMS